MDNGNIDIDEFRGLLLKIRAQIIGDTNSLRRDAAGEGATGRAHAPTHLADAASDNHDQEFSLERLGCNSETLQQIDAALDRIEAGTFGRCEECDGEIGARRLKVKPWAEMCIECKRREENS